MGSNRGLLEAVPNFSEGRSATTVDALVAAAGSVLLDRHADADHHRSVLTLAGTTAELRRAAPRLFEAARRHIDLRGHRGEHPRVGALDVFPVIPLAGATMDEAAQLARDLGRELAQSGVPVFLYGAAHPGRRPLPAIRRGGRRGLARRLARGRLRPDYGPPALHPTMGAACFGAREILIAFNVNLVGDTSRVAWSIAHAIRSQGGGLPALRAIGVSRSGGTQVSMNLLDWRRTSLKRAYAAVRRRAEAAGAGVLDSEIVGLIPEAAGWSGMEHDLRLEAPVRTIEGALAGRPGEPSGSEVRKVE